MKKHLNINNFLKKNSSTILTVIGSIGVGITAVISARDTVKAVKRINEEKPTDTKGKFKVAAPCYIPTVLCGISTILCICGANKINKNIQKSLTSAYVLLDQSYKEYRKSVKEIYGNDGDLKVIQNIADKRIEEVHITDPNSRTFFDFFSLQFFTSSLEAIYKAEEMANEMLKSKGYVSLHELYAMFGENVVGMDNLLGWSLGAGREYDYDTIELITYAMEREDGSQYFVLDFENPPTEDYLFYL